MSRLEAWWQERPAEAISVLPLHSGDYSRPAPNALPMSGSANTVPRLDEPTDPTVQALLAGVRIGPDGRAYVEDFADRVVELRGLDPFANAHTFRQLAMLACSYAGRSDCLALAYSLARVARVGLEPLARRAADRPKADRADAGKRTSPATNLERTGRKQRQLAG